MFVYRVHNALTPDKVNTTAGAGTVYSTLLNVYNKIVNNFELFLVYSPRRKNSASGRQSMMSQTTLNSTALNLRKMELEHNNLELELIYGEYIQSMAELVIANKKLKETEATYGKSIKNLSTEVKSLEEKCQVIEERNNNIQLLSNINNYEEAVQNHLKDIESWSLLTAVYIHII